MTTHELYYLILVCAAFLALGLGLAVATIRYRRSPPAEARIGQSTARAGRS